MQIWLWCLCTLNVLLFIVQYLQFVLWNKKIIILYYYYIYYYYYQYHYYHYYYYYYYYNYNIEKIKITNGVYEITGKIRKLYLPHSVFSMYSNSAPIGSDIPEDVIQSFPLEKVRDHGPLLQPGMQCRICLHGYQLGQVVRKLPRCKHKVNRIHILTTSLHSLTCAVNIEGIFCNLN